MIVAQLGARMHYAVPRIFFRAGMLERLFTDWAAPALEAPFRLPGLLRRALSRDPGGLPRSRITHFPELGFSAAMLHRVMLSEEDRCRLWISIGRDFCSRVAGCGFGAATSVYAFHSAALELFRAARNRGLFCVLEQAGAAAGPEMDLLARERAAWPGWAHDPGPRDSGTEFAAREAAEWAAADVIVCGSEFARRSVISAGGPPDRCRVVPYGVGTGSVPARCRRASGTLNVLFCGTVGLRKGAPYLLEAARRLSPSRFRFRLVGPLTLSQQARSDLARRCELTGPVPRPDMAAHYRWADVLLLPSNLGGFRDRLLRSAGRRYSRDRDPQRRECRARRAGGVSGAGPGPVRHRRTPGAARRRFRPACGAVCPGRGPCPRIHGC